MTTFRLDPAGFKEIRRRILFRSLPLAVLATFIGIYIASGRLGDERLLDSLPVLVPLMLFFLAFSFMRSIRIQKEVWKSYELTIDAERISRVQKNFATMTLLKGEVREIVETSRGHLIVKGDSRFNIIDIPRSIEKREEVLQSLADFGLIARQEKKEHWMIPILTGVLFLVLMVVFYTSKSKYVILSTGVILAIGIIWVFIEVQRNKIIDNRIKSGSYLLLPLIISIVWQCISILIDLFGG